MGTLGAWCLQGKPALRGGAGEGSKGVRFLRLSAFGPVGNVLCRGRRNGAGLHDLAHGRLCIFGGGGLFFLNLMADLCIWQLIRTHGSVVGSSQGAVFADSL